MDFKQLKDNVKSLLVNREYDNIIELAKTNKRIISVLISFSYEKTSELTWNSIQMIGRIVGNMPYEEARKQVRKLLWNATDESGTIPWTVPEILGEIIRENPTPFEDIVPILIGYSHSETEDNIFLSGVVYALGRIGQRHPKYISSYAEIIVKDSLRHKDPEVCANACIAVKRLNLTDMEIDQSRPLRSLWDELKKRDDTATVFYEDKVMTLTISQLVDLLERYSDG
ncbi:MAG: hypothetical protein HQL06_12865 [Nitrospirae bacterium]|nr:hypothetical protein [Nitrospirota bacterium]